MKNFDTKDATKQVKTQPMGKKGFLNHVSDKGLVSRM